MAGPVETWDIGDFGERKGVIFKDQNRVLLELIEQLPVVGIGHRSLELGVCLT